MQKALRRITNYGIVISILALIIGLVFIIFPNISIKTLGIISGIYLLTHGIVAIIIELKLPKIFIPYESMITGVLSVILGIVILSKPESAILLLTVAFGVWIIVSSINNIKTALFFSKIKEFPSTLMIILGIIDIILGILVVLNPFEASITITLYLGIMLITHAIFNIIDMIILKKNIHDKENLIKEKLSKLLGE